MIRFLQQKDNRFAKALFIVIIAAASISMVVYLIPGFLGMGVSASGTYAVIYPHWYSRIFSSGVTITEQRVSQLTQQRLQATNPQYADNAMIVNLYEQQIGRQLVQQEVLLAEARKLGITANDNDVVRYLHTGSTGEVLFPGGKFIGDDQYAALVSNRLNTTVQQFESDIKRDIILRRLQAYVTASVNVSDKEVRETYRKQHVKIKFDYAVISTDDLRKTINPTDEQLQDFFKKNAVRYADAVPEQRRIAYFAFTASDMPGGAPQPTPQDIQQYYNAHQSEYTVPEQARARHILIKVAPDADAKADAQARVKAENILKQIKAGSSFAEMAKKYSDDPGSKDKGGELGFAQRGTMVPEFDKAIFTQKIGDIEIVKSQYGYHIVQVEERTAAHNQPLSEVEGTIKAALIRQKAAAAEESFAHSLTSEAIKNGLQKTAAAHHLAVVTTPFMNRTTIIGTLPDSREMVNHAFASKQGDPPQLASTGEGYAIFQVTAVNPAHAPTFADWKDHIADDYRNEQLPRLLTEKVAELAAKAKAMNDLAKAAKAVGATMKTSDLIGMTDQVPDFGEVGQIAPQLFDMTPGTLSGPINAQRTGVVVRILDKQEPSTDEIAKNFDRMRDEILEDRRGQAFNLFLSQVMEEYQKHRLILLNAHNQGPSIPGM